MSDSYFDSMDAEEPTDSVPFAQEPGPQPAAATPPARERRRERRESVVDRRLGTDRRQNSDPNYKGPDRRVAERREETGLERRRGPGRRLSDDRRSAEEGEMTSEQFEFVMAIETYKKVNKRMYPTWTEVLELIRQLGYRKVIGRDVNMPGVPEAPINRNVA
jgi:hypothetical protein